LGVISILVGYIQFVDSRVLSSSISGGVLAIFCYSCWIRDIYAESFRGFHREVVQRGLKGGFTLFIISEIMFFFAFF